MEKRNERLYEPIKVVPTGKKLDKPVVTGEELEKLAEAAGKLIEADKKKAD